MDFECYRKGPYVNDEGRLAGSSRFMAPEEFQLHATIDSRTTVFNLGRLIELFLLAHNELPEVRALVDGATATAPDERPATVASLHQRWSQAMSRVL
jgi:serine/threonine-protein kinase